MIDLNSYSTVYTKKNDWSQFLFNSLYKNDLRLYNRLVRGSLLSIFC